LSHTEFLERNSFDILRKGVDTPAESPQKPPKRTGIRVLNPDSSKETPPQGTTVGSFAARKVPVFGGNVKSLKCLFSGSREADWNDAKIAEFQNLENTAGNSREAL